MNESIQRIRTKIHTYIAHPYITYLHTYIHTYIQPIHTLGRTYLLTYLLTVHTVYTYSTYVK